MSERDGATKPWPPRQPACEPCRRAKCACDHGRPVCSKCLQQGREMYCVYRSTPFKRRRTSHFSPRTTDGQSPLTSHAGPSEPQAHRSYPIISAPPTTKNTNNHGTNSDNDNNLNRDRIYTNPGHLGLSSHVAIFNQIFPEQEDEAFAQPPPSTSLGTSGSSLGPDKHPVIRRAAKILGNVVVNGGWEAMESLVQYWMSRGVNLALAEPFLHLCAQSANYFHLSPDRGHDWHFDIAQRLTENTRLLLHIDANTTFISYTAQFIGDNSRWETLGIFLCGVLRAIMDIPFFPSFYTTKEDRTAIQNKIFELIGCSLEICLALDCLNDLHHILQYENFIIHSYMNGYHLWQRLGNVISSTMALGYHENLDSKIKAPTFLIELRKTAFARIYSADKNVSLFLGRPLRFSKRFAMFQVPDSRLPLDGESSWEHKPLAANEWVPDSAMNYRAESRWSALCASIKEDIMELIFDHSPSNCTDNINNLQATADAQWNALPERFRLQVGVKLQAEDPFERDFIISIRLNYLHTIFLIRRLALEKMSESGEPLVEVCIEILSLAVKVVILRDELSNSGTRLSWKIAHYGLPASGILLLAFLKPHPIHMCLQMARSEVLQNLAVLAAEIEGGTVARPEDPNYALLREAAQTIHRFLDFIHNSQPVDTASEMLFQSPDESLWVQQLGQDLLGSDMLFWQGIAEHPLLYNHSPLLNAEEQQI